jgi:hypothetical protein
MLSSTVHVYKADKEWRLQKAGEVAKVFKTKRDARSAAVLRVRKESGQVAVHASDGRIVESIVHGLPKIQPLPWKRTLADRKIARLVGSFSLAQLKAEAPSAQAPAK